MSESEGKKLLEQNLEAFGELKSKIEVLEGKDFSGEAKQAATVAVADIQEKMNEMEAKQLEIAKQLEVEKVKSAQLNSIDKDQVKRSQIVEFGKKFVEACKTGDAFSSLSLKGFKEYEAKAAAQFNELSDPNGGLAVMPEVDTMIDSLVREYSNIRQWCANGTTQSNIWERPFLNKTNGAQREKDLTSFTTATKTDTLSKISIPVARLFSIIPIDSDLIDDDMIGFVNELMASAAEDFVITESEEFVNGDGKSEFSGIKNTTDGTAYNEIERYTTAGSTVIAMDDLINLMGKLKSAYKRNAAWYMPREIMTLVRLLKDSQNNYLWQPSNILGQPATLFGHAVRELAELDTSQAVAGNIPMAFGDLRGYRIIDRAGTEVSRDPHSDYPNVLMRVKKRSGGGLTKGEMIKLLKIKA